MKGTKWRLQTIWIAKQLETGGRGRVWDRSLSPRQHMGKKRRAQRCREDEEDESLSVLTGSPDRAALGKLHLRCSWYGCCPAACTHTHRHTHKDGRELGASVRAARLGEGLKQDGLCEEEEKQKNGCVSEFVCKCYPLKVAGKHP